MAVVAMGGLSGGGARDLGPMVAERLGADYVDRLILTGVARHVGATVEALHQREERPPTRGERFSRVLQRILERSAMAGAGGDPYFGPGVAPFLTEEYEDLPQHTIVRGHELEDEKYHQAVSDVIHDMAARGNVVLVGRGSCVILRDISSVLRVGVVASLEDRVAKIIERERLDEEQAVKTILARDEARAHMFKRFFGLDDPDSSDLYHLLINASDVSLEYAADIVTQAAAAIDEGRLPKRVKAAV